MFETVYSWAQSQLANNEILAGLIGGSLFASGLYMLRDVPKHISRFLIFHFTVVAECYNDTEAYTWFSSWINQTDYIKASRRIRISTRWIEGQGDREDRLMLIKTVGEGRHIFRYRGRWIVLTQETDESGPNRGKEVRESYTVRVVGRDPSFLAELFENARKSMRYSDTVDVYSFDDYWQLSARKMPRPIGSVVMPAGEREALLEDIRWFLDNPKWYSQRGIPYRRGYLFSGPPGTGKTSLAMALASELQLPLFSLHIGSVDNDRHMNRAFLSARGSSLLLIEDIDASHSPRTEGKKKDDAESITLSGLLNAIDGVSSPEGRVLIMTSNFPDQIDGALLRPGRVDVNVRFRKLDLDSANRMFRNFYPDSALRIRVIASLSPAELQRIFLEYPDDPAGAIEALGAIGESAG